MGNSKPKMTIIHADGTTVEVEPLKAWDPGEVEPELTPGSLLRAMRWCKVRGYIARASKPQVKYWKNTDYFWRLPFGLPIEDRDALDWEDFDPADDEPPSYLMA